MAAFVNGCNDFYQISCDGMDRPSTKTQWEIRSGKLITGCECVKRNGLQSECYVPNCVHKGQTREPFKPNNEKFVNDHNKNIYQGNRMEDASGAHGHHHQHNQQSGSTSALHGHQESNTQHPYTKYVNEQVCPEQCPPENLQCAQQQFNQCQSNVTPEYLVASEQMKCQQELANQNAYNQNAFHNTNQHEMQTPAAAHEPTNNYECNTPRMQQEVTTSQHHCHHSTPEQQNLHIQQQGNQSQCCEPQVQYQAPPIQNDHLTHPPCFDNNNNEPVIPVSQPNQFQSPPTMGGDHACYEPVNTELKGSNVHHHENNQQDNRCTLSATNNCVCNEIPQVFSQQYAIHPPMFEGHLKQHNNPNVQETVTPEQRIEQLVPEPQELSEYPPQVRRYRLDGQECK